jgi:alpha-glucosidase
MPIGGGPFNSYEPPRYAVAETDVHPARRAWYASADSLGNAFNFDMQDADWRADEYRHVINNGLADMINNGSTTSWLLGCHDLPRVASRYGLPLDKDRPAHQVARTWLLTDGATPRLDRALARSGSDHDLVGAAGLDLHLPGRRAGAP